MNRARLAAALAAAGVIAVVVFTPAAVEAAPVPAGPPLPGQCTLSEWRNPLNMLKCADKGIGALQDAASCLQAPTPTGPSSGFAGQIAQRPDASLRGGVPGQYTDYGDAGYGFSTYGLGCVSGVTHATASTQNDIADMIMSASAGWLSIANTARNAAYDPHSIWGWSDSLVDDAVHQLYQHVWLGVTAVFIGLTGLLIIWKASGDGNLPDAFRKAGWALVVTVGVTIVFQWPSASAELADRAGTSALETVHSAVGLGPQPVSPADCVLGADGCADHRTASDRTSDTITTALLYRNWLTAELGSADSDAAKMYGPALFRAQALTWGEDADIKAHPETRAVVYAEKARLWNETAKLVQAQDPQAYEYLQGLHGGDRLDTSALTAVEVFLFTSFDLAASLVLILAFGMFRLVIISLPITGAVGVCEPASAAFRWTLNVAARAFRNIIAFGAGSCVYTFLVDAFFSADQLPAIVQTFLMGVSGVGMWILVVAVRSKVPARPATRTTTVHVGEVMPGRHHTTVPATAVEVVRRPESFRPTPVYRPTIAAAPQRAERRTPRGGNL